ncbi:MAG: NAD(P)H-hydrate dehydratase [Pseudomonadota bacterium]
MQNLPHNLYRAADTRALDRLAIEAGTPGITLMERAGAAAFDLLRKCWPQAQHLAVFCGGGNNGGDGFVIARLAKRQGMMVSVFLLADAAKLKGEALQSYQAMLAEHVSVEAQLPADLQGFDLAVDSLLGTGLSEPVRGPYQQAIELMNASTIPVLAIDIPSGLSADTGVVLGVAVKAQATITYIGVKQGLLTGAGPDYCGELVFAGLGVPEAIYAQVPPAAHRIDYALLKPQLPPRARGAHKGAHGHVLLIGGETGMSGAITLAGEAALRCGAGLVSIATRREHAALISAARPELMSHGVETQEEFAALLDRANVVAIGPGLGRSEWGRRMLRYVLGLKRPVVIDADGLNLLAEQPCRHDHWILTPHPGEAARLLDVATATVQADRFEAARALQQRYGGVVALKGAGSLICDDQQQISLCTDGNPGMGSGGMGDVLTGVIAALLAQGFTRGDAARLGVCLHSAAADRAAHDGERGLIASDLMAHLRRLANP